MTSLLGVRYDEDGRPRDWQGRVVPHQFGLLNFIRALPGFLDQFAAIPGEFWSEDVDGEIPIAVVACPCGHEPQVKLNTLSECECHRFFMFTGRDVRVANGPGQYAEQPLDPAAIE